MKNLKLEWVEICHLSSLLDHLDLNDNSKFLENSYYYRKIIKKLNDIKEEVTK